jgi:hypothetical protein
MSSSSSYQLYFLADVTGSMTAVLNDAKSHAANLTAQILAAMPNTQFGAGWYKDFPMDDYAFMPQSNKSTGMQIGNIESLRQQIGQFDKVGNAANTFLTFQAVSTPPVALLKSLATSTGGRPTAAQTDPRGSSTP